ncbi:hypothetical protein F3Y22_tig00111191pilonHSYRG00067 [Hibiscus syriacus]|uniref:Protein-tyrosine-phosphatase MKP1 C-terminal domain-containing protein n=1 Tax=Hibiscus syriacus TaxID=106335 RepID=A0A6A2YWB2_HIBSY|nr:hypothetical protein F3Y22_tig00111191pilonHSYRG00067 [Hibiscus syriacus]
MRNHISRHHKIRDNGNDVRPDSPGPRRNHWHFLLLLQHLQLKSTLTSGQIPLTEDKELGEDPNGNDGNNNGRTGRFPPPPLTPPGSDDLGEWPQPPTPSGNKSGERIKLDLSSIQWNNDKNGGLLKRYKIAFFDKECSKVAEHIYLTGDAVAKDRKILKKNELYGCKIVHQRILLAYFMMFLTISRMFENWLEEFLFILPGRIEVHIIGDSVSYVDRGPQSFDDAFQYVKAARGIADPNMELHLVAKMLNDPSPSGLDSRVMICPGERKVGSYNVDFEIFEKAIKGGFVPPFASSENEFETHLPARETNWSMLQRKFASGIMEFVSAPNILISRVYSDSMMIVHASLPSLTSVFILLASLSLTRFHLFRFQHLFKLPFGIFSRLTFIYFILSSASSRLKKVSPSLAERRDSLSKSLKLPVRGGRNGGDILIQGSSLMISPGRLADADSRDTNSTFVNACESPGNPSPKDCLACAVPNWMGETIPACSGVLQPLVCRWPRKLNSVSGSVVGDRVDIDWNQIGYDVLTQVGLPKDTPVKIVKEDGEPPFLMLLKTL